MTSNGAAIATPIVVAIFLAIWIGALFYADIHPEHKRRSKLPQYEVTGGAFQARDGGRQLMPLPERPPIPTEAEKIAAGATIPAPRAATGAAHAATTPAEGENAEEPHLVAGSKLRLAMI
jgi:hypothetical protein